MPEHPVTPDRVALALLEQEQADTYYEEQDARAALERPRARPGTPEVPSDHSIPQATTERLPQLVAADTLEAVIDDLGPNRGLQHRARSLVLDIRAEFRVIR